MKLTIACIYGLLLFYCASCDNKISGSQEARRASRQSARANAAVPQLAGTWMADCNDVNGHIYIPGTVDTATIEVNSNQIVISTKIDTSGLRRTGEILLRLIEPTDLGPGGARLHWDDFSRDSVVAKMVLTSSGNAKVTWYGFYDKEMRQWTWQHNFDPLTSIADTTVNQVALVHCDDAYL